MSVVIETTLGDITVDLYLSDRPRTSLNFLKLCAVKYYNYNLFHTISRGFIAQTGDPTGSRSGGESIYGVLEGSQKRYFEAESEPRIKHTKMGLISFVGNKDRMIGSQFFITLGENLTYLDEKHCVFGEVVEGFDVLEVINEVICDSDDRPYQDVRITHTVILDDPFPQPKRLIIPSRSPSPCAERLQGGRIAPDEEIDETEGKTIEEVSEMQAEQEAKARATILEMVGDIPDADMAPPENVLFVCKLNPVTTDDDLEIIFNRFGKIKSCEVIRDRKTGDSLQYAFIEFEEQKSCEDAYFKMDNILIDDRRIHVDFSQSVSKVKWLGKGRGVAHYDERGEKTNIGDSNIGKGNYTRNEKSDCTEQSSDNIKQKVQNKSSRSGLKYDRPRTQSHHHNSHNRDRSLSRSKIDYKSNVQCHKSREQRYSEYDKRGSKNDKSNATYGTKKTFSRRNYGKEYSKQKGHSYESDEDDKSKKTKKIDREVVKKKNKSQGKYSSDDSDSEDYNKRKDSNKLDQIHKDSKKIYSNTQMDRKKNKFERKYSLNDSDSEVEQKNKLSSKTYRSELDKKNKKKKKSCSKDTSSSDSDYRKTKKLKKSKRRKYNNESEYKNYH